MRGPSNQRLSVDSFIWKYTATAPNFNLLTLKLQTEIILVYAGLVKINSKSNWNNFKVPDLVKVASAMGFDLLADYDCKFQGPPKRAEGNDLHCLRK